jgi:hypothetical protein
MTSLGFSEYTESNNNNEPKNNIRRNGASGGGGGLKNRTLKIPRNQETVQSQPANDESATSTTAGKKIKQIKDYIENIHRKGGEDSDEDPEDASSILPSYPAQEWVFMRQMYRIRESFGVQKQYLAKHLHHKWFAKQPK